MPVPRFVPVAGVVGCLLLAGCATTTTETVGATTTTTDPSATTTVFVDRPLGAVLPEMVRAALGLGDAIFDGGDADDDALAGIHRAWDGTNEAMNDIDPALFREVEHQLGLLDVAVKRKRPADADKAARNLEAVVDTYLARYPA